MTLTSDQTLPLQTASWADRQPVFTDMNNSSATSEAHLLNSNLV